MASIRRMFLTVRCRPNQATPDGGRFVAIVALEKRHQTIREQRPTGHTFFRRGNNGSRFECIERDCKMRCRTRVLIILSCPAEPWEIHAASQAHGVEHPVILCGQYASS